ncbi:MAG: TonB-dependent receptor [Acidobacteria bacterium]|nr:TonB-dependent receptor [Acidobacteriota bacterium]
MPGKRLCVVLSLFALIASFALAQATLGSLKGVITDESGAVVPNTKITLAAGRTVRTVQSGADGSYVLAGLPTGTYTFTAEAAGLARYQNVNVAIASGGTATLNIQLKVQMETQQVTVQDSNQNQVSTDPSANVGALVLKADDLAALSDDPDDLAEDLQALAGPSAGPNGSQMFIDGFTGGRLPPKESIREVRINQNPFSAEYDRLGFGRIEIFTKPGADKMRGMAFFNFSDGVFDGRNPYAQNKAPFQYRNYGGNLSGPVTKKSSFFLDFEKRDTDENAVVNATTLDSNLNITPLAQAILTPNRRTTFSPRLDYQLTQNITLMGRYSFTDSSSQNTGVGGFVLPSTGNNTDSTMHSLQMTETQIIGGKAVNETRFQYLRDASNQKAINNAPLINVLDAFTGGGSAVGLGGYNNDNRYELQNYTSITHSTHTIRFGGRVRVAQLSTSSVQNFNGTFTFTGGLAPALDAANQPTGVTAQISSIEAYRRTLLFQGLGYTPTQIRALGGEPTQFTLSGGQPLADVTQTDLGIFAQDDWRLKPNFTLSMGLRYETQTNIHDWTDFAPRLGFAWAPGAKGARPGKTVVRGGAGIFYDRFSESLTLNTIRYNGVNQQQFTIANPDFYPTVPAIANLVAQALPQTRREMYKDLRAPYIVQSAIGVERQLPWNSSMAVTYTNSHGLHELDSRNINFPDANGVKPYPNLGVLSLYESNGIYNQNQMNVNFNIRASRTLTLFTGYGLNFVKSDSDGAGSYPVDQNNLGAEYGRAAQDIRHRFFLGGSVATRWGIRLSPFITAHSGAPFNIVAGRDFNGDLIINDRPAFASASQVGQPNIVSTPWGIFNTKPGAGDKIITRNLGTGPSFFSVNLRLSKTFGFGPERGGAAQNPAAGGGMGGPGGGGGGGAHGGGGRGGMGGGGMRMGGGGRGGMGGMFGDSSSSKRYNLVVSVNARNLLNTTNQGQYNGNLSSTYFGTSNALASGGFGGDRGNAATNRRIDLSLRFTF